MRAARRREVRPGQPTQSKTSVNVVLEEEKDVLGQCTAASSYYIKDDYKCRLH